MVFFVARYFGSWKSIFLCRSTCIKNHTAKRGLDPIGTLGNGIVALVALVVLFHPEDLEHVVQVVVVFLLIFKAVVALAKDP